MGSGAPFVSVVVPVHEDPLLERCVSSVLAQEASFEVVVVDDGSSDDTPSVVARLARDARVRSLRVPNGGPAAARNAGIAAATGRHVTFLDSDDEALPGWLARCTEELEASGALLLFHGYEQVAGDRQGAVLPADLGALFANRRGTFLPGTFVVDREVLRSVGGYEPVLRYAENTELGLRLLDELDRRGTSPVVVDEVLVRRYDNPTRDYDAARGDAARWLLEHHAERFRRSRRARAEHLAIVGVSEARLGRLGAARRSFLRAALAAPLDRRAWGRLALTVAPGAAASRWPRSTVDGGRAPEARS